jgi:hypothetical protein
VRLEGETDGFDRDSATAGLRVDGVADVDVAGFRAVDDIRVAVDVTG